MLSCMQLVAIMLYENSYAIKKGVQYTAFGEKERWQQRKGYNHVNANKFLKSTQLL